jgi:SAM-dependent methyltransferase
MATSTIVSSQCTVCGDAQWQFVRAGRDLYQPADEELFRLARCGSCGQVMQNPLPTPEQLSKGYSAQYAPYQPAWKQSGWPLWKVLREWTTRRRMRRLQRYGKGRMLLEVGCGAGDFLYAASHAGWDVRAVEYSSAVAETVRNELGYDVRSGDLVPGLWEHGSFDAIILWSVLEHLPNPSEALRIASAYLKPGGAMFIQVPTLYGITQGMRFRDYWALLDLPRHLSFFNKECLATLCDQAGMRLTVFKTPFLEIAWCYFASISNYSAHCPKPRRRVTTILSLGLFSLLALPMMVVRAWRARGTEAFAVAVKR